VSSIASNSILTHAFFLGAGLLFYRAWLAGVGATHRLRAAPEVRATSVLACDLPAHGQTAGTKPMPLSLQPIQTIAA